MDLSYALFTLCNCPGNEAIIMLLWILGDKQNVLRKIKKSS